MIKQERTNHMKSVTLRVHFFCDEVYTYAAEGQQTLLVLGDTLVKISPAILAIVICTRGVETRLSLLDIDTCVGG